MPLIECLASAHPLDHPGVFQDARVHQRLAVPLRCSRFSARKYTTYSPAWELQASDQSSQPWERMMHSPGSGSDQYQFLARGVQGDKLVTGIVIIWCNRIWCEILQSCFLPCIGGMSESVIVGISHQIPSCLYFNFYQGPKEFDHCSGWNQSLKEIYFSLLTCMWWFTSYWLHRRTWLTLIFILKNKKKTKF